VANSSGRTWRYRLQLIPLEQGRAHAARPGKWGPKPLTVTREA